MLFIWVYGLGVIRGLIWGKSVIKLISVGSKKYLMGKLFYDCLLVIFDLFNWLYKGCF